GSLARAGAGRTPRDRRAEPPRPLGPLRAHALRHRPALFALPAHPPAAGRRIYADALERRPAFPALAAQIPAAPLQPLRTARAAAMADFLGSGHCRGAETALSGPPRRRPRLAPHPRAGADAAGGVSPLNPCAA